MPRKVRIDFIGQKKPTDRYIASARPELLNALAALRVGSLNELRVVSEELMSLLVECKKLRPSVGDYISYFNDTSGRLEDARVIKINKRSVTVLTDETGNAKLLVRYDDIHRKVVGGSQLKAAA